MSNPNTEAAVLWSGGKDCSLSLHKAVLAGLNVRYLVTFAPPNAQFLAHPLPVMQSQAEALGLSHLILEIVEPYAVSYRDAIQSLKDRYGINTFITGDIAEVDHCPNWIKQCCEGTGVSVYTPLWDNNREKILSELIDNGFKIIFSCVKQPALSPNWLGREINRETLADLQALQRENGTDPCGENGEYHTMTLDGPLFKKKIQLSSYQTVVQESMAYMYVEHIELLDKA